MATQAEEARRTMVTIEDDKSSVYMTRPAQSGHYDPIGTHFSTGQKFPSTNSSNGDCGTNTTIKTECSESIPANVNVMVTDNSTTKK